MAAATVPGVAGSGIGLDTDELTLDRGRALAAECGVRVRFVNQPAEEWAEPADAVICVGSFGGTERALSALARLVPPDARPGAPAGRSGCSSIPLTSGRRRCVRNSTRS